MAPQKQNLSSSAADKLAVPAELIDRRIYIVRGKKVMLVSDLAELYQVTAATSTAYHPTHQAGARRDGY